MEEGWVDKTCRVCKKDTSGGPRQKDKFGRYAHVACLEKSKSSNFFSRLFSWCKVSHFYLSTYSSFPFSIYIVTVCFHTYIMHWEQRRLEETNDVQIHRIELLFLNDLCLFFYAYLRNFSLVLEIKRECCVINYMVSLT